MFTVFISTFFPVRASLFRRTLTMIKKTAHQPKLVPESIFFFIHTNDMVTHLIMETAWVHLEASLAEKNIH